MRKDPTARGREFVVQTDARITALDITGHVRAIIQALAIADGLVLIGVPHTTCAVVVNQFQSTLLDGLQRSVLEFIEAGRPFRHDDARYSDCERGNATAHLATALLGTSVVVPVKDGDMALGRFQSVILLEFDGPRQRRVTTAAVCSSRDASSQAT